jgi:hypothetical protein
MILIPLALQIARKISCNGFSIRGRSVLQPLPSLMQASDTLKQITSCLVACSSMLLVAFSTFCVLVAEERQRAGVSFRLSICLAPRRWRIASDSRCGCQRSLSACRLMRCVESS